MKILLDHCVDWRLAQLVPGHEIVTTRRMRWEQLRNGALLSAAEAEGFAIFLTVDKNLRYQQSMAGRTISVVTMNSKYVDAASLAPLIPALMRALDSILPGAFLVIGPGEENGYT